MSVCAVLEVATLYNARLLVRASGREPKRSRVGVSPSGKAAGFDPAIRRFESCHPSQDL